MPTRLPALKFDPRDAERVFELAARSGSRLILIGGQAVNFWAEVYRNVEPALQNGPFTSKDVDVQAEADALQNCARALNVTPQLVPDGKSTLLQGRIVYMLDGRLCDIDFLERSAPNTKQEVEETAVSIQRPWGTLWVMHPFMCMRSRVYNVVQLAEKYDTDHGREQLAASIVCVRRYATELLTRHGQPPREALKIFSRVFEYCMHDDDATRAYEMGYDPFSAVADHRALPGNFGQKCLPRWRAQLHRLRARKLRNSADPTNTDQEPQVARGAPGTSD